MMKVKQLVPREADIDLTDVVEILKSPQTLRMAFSDQSIAFCDELSQALFKDTNAVEFPEILALAFWLRKASITKMKTEFQARVTKDVVMVPRGLAFHICPSNVDTIFVYSWIISLLCGNSNILRLSRRSAPQVDLLCRAINQTLALPNLGELASSVAILTYGHELEFTQVISEASDMRVIWGGDASVQFVKNVPTKISTKDIAFRDRNSMAALKAKKLSELSPASRKNLLARFFNDAFWFDQMACSSPRTIIWIGSTDEITAARDLFIEGLDEILKEKNFSNETGTVLDKMTFAYNLAANELPVEIKTLTNRATFCRFGKLTNILRDHCGGGFFFEYESPQLASLAEFVSERDQTLTVFGFEQSELHALVEKTKGRGLDRIVPFGSALSFHWIWDGYDLFQEFTKKIFLTSDLEQYD